MKFGHLILGKIIKLAATSCQILTLKCARFYFGWGSASHPAAGAYGAPPDPITGLRGPTSKGREMGRRGETKGGGGKEERERECLTAAGQWRSQWWGGTPPPEIG